MCGGDGKGERHKIAQSPKNNTNEPEHSPALDCADRQIPQQWFDIWVLRALLLRLRQQGQVHTSVPTMLGAESESGIVSGKLTIK